jgi:hypothetical protein
MINKLPSVEPDGRAVLERRVGQSASPIGQSFIVKPSDVVAAQSRLISAAARRQAQKPKAAEEYYGGDRNEEVVPKPEQVEGLLTRNHYGCTVLNATHALFIDVDVLGERNEYLPLESRQQVLHDLRDVLAAEWTNGFRIYRTSAGFRILATSHEFEPGSSEADRLMSAVGADAAFVELCRVQNSFRARLSPKPWRCGMRRPPNFYPRETARERLRFAEWLSRYERACRNFSTCQFLGHVGPENIHDRIAPIIDLHDRETKAHVALPLA